MFLDDHVLLSLWCHTVVARRSVYYVDVLAVWYVSRVISGNLANTISDVWSHVDRRGSWRVSRGTALLLHHLGHFWYALRDLVLMY